MDPKAVHTRTQPGKTALIFRDQPPGSCALVLFGITGDLARSKLVPALYHLERSGRLPPAFALVGVSRSARTNAELATSLRASTETHSRSGEVEPGPWESFAARIQSVTGDVTDSATYKTLDRALATTGAGGGACANRVFYVATPSSLFPPILAGLEQAGLLSPRCAGQGEPWTHLVMEKPFGTDLASARDLNRRTASVLREDQIFRVDHYLAKETVQNIMAFRFGNAIFEPLWNNRYIEHVQITAAEEAGVEHRGAFYDETGVVRDVVQNHLLQVLALCAMESPVRFDAEEIRNEKTKVFRALRPLGDEDLASRVVLGQYRGYGAIDGVAPGSRTPTYAALQVMIDNWRWQGVPFFLRAGKRLARRRTEVSIRFRTIPFCLFGGRDMCSRIDPNVLTLRIQPDDGITLAFVAKVPGDGLELGRVTMDFSYERAFQKSGRDAYERLLLDCMRGDQTLFARADGVELQWAYVAPLLAAAESGSVEVVPYEPGSEGPGPARTLVPQGWRPLP